MDDTPHDRLAGAFNFTESENFEVYLVYFTNTVASPQNQKAIDVLRWSWAGATQYNASDRSQSAVPNSLSPTVQTRKYGDKLTPSNQGTGIRDYDTTPIQTIDPNNRANYKACQ
jgi:hypothetical protein